MDISSLAGMAAQMNLNSAREGISLMAMKQAAEAGQKVAELLAQSASAQKPDSSYNFSMYA